jgi:hypothetical protein
LSTAYLVLTHSHPELLGRLAAALEDARAHVFVHVDGKVDIAPFVSAAAGIRNVTFLEERVPVFWMGYSQVVAELALMRAARAHSPPRPEPFRRYVLLSGTDYPIKSTRHIQDLFALASDTEYLLYWKLEDWPEWRHKIEKYHFLDSRLTNRRSMPVPISYAVYRAAHALVHAVTPKRTYLPGLTPFGGSAWWMLTDAAVGFILDYLARSADFVRFYRFTHVPDEMVFHTILLNSPLAERMSHRARYEQLVAAQRRDDQPAVMALSHAANLRYVDWDPRRDFPAVLDERDFDALARSEGLFARKMHPARSRRLLDRIDAELRR